MSQQLAMIEVIIYAPGFTMLKRDMDESEEQHFWVTREVIDWLVTYRPDYYSPDRIDGSPYLVARELTDEEKKSGLHGDFIFTDWGMTIDVKVIDNEMVGSGFFSDGNWLNEQLFGFGAEHFLYNHLESILNVASELGDELYRRGEHVYPGPIHVIQFLSLWRMECHMSRGADGDDWDCEVYLEGRVNPASLRVVAP